MKMPIIISLKVVIFLLRKNNKQLIGKEPEINKFIMTAHGGN